MEKELEKILKNEFINFNGSFAIYANDYKGNKISINENEKFNAASCIKIFILVELFRQVYLNKKSFDEKLKYKKDNFVNGSGILQYLTEGLELSVKDIATLMMIISDNVATNIMIDYLGINNINKTIKDLGCLDTELYFKFESCEDKVFSITTAKDYSRIYELINEEKL